MSKRIRSDSENILPPVKKPRELDRYPKAIKVDFRRFSKTSLRRYVCLIVWCD